MENESAILVRLAALEEKVVLLEEAVAELTERVGVLEDKLEELSVSSSDNNALLLTPDMR